MKRKRNNINVEERKKSAKYMIAFIVIMLAFFIWRSGEPLGLIIVAIVPILMSIKKGIVPNDGSEYFKLVFILSITCMKWIAIMIVFMKLIKYFLPSIYANYFI